MTEFVLNTYSDVQLLANIFNGQAMLVSNVTAVNNYWLAIALAAFSGLFFAVVSKLNNLDNKVVLNGAWMNFVAGIILVMMFTGLTGRVLIQSERDGTTKAVDNVPVLSFAVPVLMSNLSVDFARTMETAYQPPFAVYTMLGGTSNQSFGEPLRALLSTRTALLRLPQIQSDLREVIGACIDSSYNYAKVNQMVMFAGETAAGGGASTDSVGIMGLSVPTSVGVLLKQAAANTSAYVTGLTPPSAATVALSCPNAVDLVVAEIDAAFGSSIFSSNATRAPGNAADSITKTDYSFDVLSNIYGNVRNFAAATGADAVAASQANAELINMIFNQEIMRDLDCLKEGGSNKTTCLGTASLANAIEQGNIDAAANGSAFLASFGAFADSLFAVIIGLTPVYIIVMIFLGQKLSRMMFAYLQTMLWSVLVYNFGAVLVNSIILYKISAALQALAGGSIINQADGMEAYRILSMQVGASASMLTSLTMLIPTLFSLSQSATMAGVASKSTGQDRYNEKAVAPDLIAPAPILRMHSPAEATPTPGGPAVTKIAGAVEGTNASVQLGRLTREFQEASEQQARVEHYVQDRVEKSNEFAQRASHGTLEDDRLSDEARKALQVAYSESERASQREQDSSGVNYQNRKYKGHDVAIGGSIGFSAGPSGAGPSGGVNLSSNSKRGSDTSTSTDEGTSRQTSAESAYARDQQAINSLTRMKQHSTSTSESTAIDAAIREVKAHAVSDTDVRSLSNSARNTASLANNISALSNNVGDQQIALASHNNPSFNRLMNDSQIRSLGPEFDNAYKQSRQYLDSGNSVHFSGPNAQQAKHNTASIRALSNMAADTNIDPQKRAQAVQILASGLAAVTGTTQLQATTLNKTPEMPTNPYRTTSPTAAFAPMKQVTGNMQNSVPEAKNLNKEVDTFQTKVEANRGKISTSVNDKVKSDNAQANGNFGENRAEMVSDIPGLSEKRNATKNNPQPTPPAKPTPPINQQPGLPQKTGQRPLDPQSGSQTTQRGGKKLDGSTPDPWKTK